MLQKMLLSSPLPVNLGLLVARIGVGGMMAWFHGYGKIMGGVDRWRGLGEAMSNFNMPESTYVFWGFMAAVAEFFGGILLALGLLHRLAAFLLVNTMVVAATMHLINEDGKHIYPTELGFVFLALLITGPGRYSLDHLFFGRSRIRVVTHIQ